METLAFYSYKGGVGRSLLLADAARSLATSGKGVVALDLDLEAPALHYKLLRTDGAGLAPSTVVGGAVRYLLATAKGAETPPPLEDHMIDIPVSQAGGGWLRFMPAGPAPHRVYWEALKQLGTELKFSDPSGRGVMVLLDLHARIEQALHPDYLLIDACTGVTELGGLVITMLADRLICLIGTNPESLDGTLAIVEALETAPRLEGRGQIDVVSLLSEASDHERLEGHSLVSLDKLLRKSTVDVLPNRTDDDHLKVLSKLFSLPAHSVWANP